MTEAAVKTVSSDPAVSADMGTDPKKVEAAATEVEIDLGGKKVKVAPEVSAALEAATKAAREAGESVQSLRAQMNEMAEKVVAGAQPTKKPATPDLATLMYTDPDAYTSLVEERIIAKVQEAQAVTAKQQEFWGEFYRQNKDLQEHDSYVRYIFQRDFDSMKKAGLTIGEAIKKIAETTKGDMVKLRGKSGTTQKPIAEGGNESGNFEASTASNAGKGSEDSPNIGLTASILSERKAARQAAKQPGRKK